jgi:HD-GYP domain-containing protein (c-di-GMP phosphodiesterase class II)
MKQMKNLGDPVATITHILKLSEELNEHQGLDAVLDRILHEAQDLSSADAGTIYLREGGTLKFSYVHNRTLMKPGEVNKEIYSNLTTPVNEESIVGYVAHHGETLNIDDAYQLPPGAPYRFNPSFDEKSGYRTGSIFTMPIKTSQGRVVGVLQLINAKNEKGETVPFSRETLTYLPLFANNASIAIERTTMTKELILRMMKTAELRDPSETGPHVQRVGAYSAEIYHALALKKGIPEADRKRFKDLIRVAAMLHDVGKVGIPDSILKKPAKLNEEEFDIMRFHTVFGARLFVNSTSDLDAMSGEIALNHHEKWGGGGYPGRIADLHCQAELGERKKGEEIPLAARITALADVFDALCSRRSYKKEWSDDKILEVVREESGKHFDPEVVDAFLSIFDVITAIREKFTEGKSQDAECAIETKLHRYEMERNEEIKKRL